MPPAIAWLPALAPLLLVATACAAPLAGRRDPRLAGSLVLLGASGAFLVALLATAALVASGPLHAVLGERGLGPGIRIDALSATMATLVAFLGVVVVRFSLRYLAGDPGQPRFLCWLGLTLACVLAMILAGTLLQLVAAWIGTSLALHRLLLFRPERRAAQLAARKKFIVSRFGDACLLGAAVLIWQGFGTLDLAALSDAARAAAQAGTAPAGIQGAALLIAAAALMKSAQFPVHGWLAEAMDTPTPVSALLHAGLVNGGGFLVVRLSDVMVLSAPSLHVLALVGGFTALLGSAVMLTQTSIKVSLAWSTIAQMGFMLLQCGLGAFSTAVLHIVAHSLYKAHAFLASGSVIDAARAPSLLGGEGALHPAAATALFIGAVVLAFGVGHAMGTPFMTHPGAVVLGAILALSLVQLVAASAEGGLSGPLLARCAVLAAGVAALSFALQAGASRLLGAALAPEPALHGPADLGIAALAIASFAALAILQALLPARGAEPRWRAAYVHIANGLYANALADRVMARLWPLPSRIAQPGASS